MTKLYFCAEVGSNHCGFLDYAIQHIKAAKRAGANAVKFQYFIPELLTSKEKDTDILQKYALPKEWFPVLKIVARDENIKIGYSVFHPSLVQDLVGFSDFLKISAYDFTYLNLVYEAARTQIPLILSTAMANTEELTRVRDLLESLELSTPPIYLTGTAAYPTHVKDAHTSRITSLRYNVFPAKVGLSDHTLSHYAAMSAICFGATYFEKHFTILNIPSSPDTLHSLSPNEFRSYKEDCLLMEKVIGESWLGVREVETPLYEHARRTNQKPLRD